eukprot:CAMPEP_0172510274 /NCGR_PEP_ID=MMETSP1066-20121228/227559_1 /TAXON_ID=671091 /ORGANISM="Coscinodiscus wailesii, Strain CCMP2513" /LENGTH=82 /DNA_ID=CAMNT_0013289169 /DNA_START=240 /DNA_END=488 /DNA_ORIENTATION=+
MTRTMSPRHDLPLWREGERGAVRIRAFDAFRARVEGDAVEGVADDETFVEHDTVAVDGSGGVVGGPMDHVVDVVLTGKRETQ